MMPARGTWNFLPGAGRKSTGTSKHEICLLQSHQARSNSSAQISEYLSSPESPNPTVRGAAMLTGGLSEGLRMFGTVEGCSAGSGGEEANDDCSFFFYVLKTS